MIIANTYIYHHNVILYGQGPHIPPIPQAHPLGPLPSSGGHMARYIPLDSTPLIVDALIAYGMERHQARVYALELRGHSDQQIAEMAGLSIGSVRNRRSEARRLLRSRGVMLKTCDRCSRTCRDKNVHPGVKGMVCANWRHP